MATPNLTPPKSFLRDLRWSRSGLQFPLRDDAVRRRGFQSPEWQSRYPRLHDLFRSISHGSALSAWRFRKLERRFGPPESCAVLLAREPILQRLDPVTWAAFRERVGKRLRKVDQEWSWNRLAFLLNLARGYELLVDLGCSAPTLLPGGKHLGPDFAGEIDGGSVCVKTFTMSLSERQEQILEEWVIQNVPSEVSADDATTGAGAQSQPQPEPKPEPKPEPRLIPREFRVLARDSLAVAQVQRDSRWKEDGIARRITLLVTEFDASPAAESAYLADVLRFIRMTSRFRPKTGVWEEIYLVHGDRWEKV